MRLSNLQTKENLDMSRRFVISASLVLLLVQLSCKTNPVDPPTSNPRDYTFTIDTLAYPGSFQTMMYDLWASSPTSVWAVGHNDQNRGLMWHFNGTEWTDVKLSTTQGGSIEGPIDLDEVFGFNSVHVFAVGRRLYSNPTPPPYFLDSSLVIRFDGQQWQEELVQRGRALWSISGSSPRDIWTCGSSGTIFHYNGSLWKRDTIPLVVPSDVEYALWDIKSAADGEAFMTGAIRDNSLMRTTNYFFKLTRGNWSIIDSFAVQPGGSEVRFGVHGLWLAPEGTLYSFGWDIFRWTGMSWTRLYQSSGALRRMAGSSDTNIFAVGDFGTVLHYNGIDWYEFEELKNPNIVFSSVWTDGNQVFIIGFFNGGSKTVVLRGK
ncbi:MAG: hypothetical protein WD182_04360 [Bacteroidota bacterium]